RGRRGRLPDAALAARRRALPQWRAFAADGTAGMSSVVLAIDCGNTRLKWGVHEGGAWRVTDAVQLGAIPRLQVQWRSLETPRRVLVSNVAGEAVASELAKLIAHWPVEATWIRAQRKACGVTNSYSEPERLGSDRWAALIAARALHRGPALVVN